MNHMEMEVAVRAAREKAPAGMGGFALREIVFAALVAAEEFRTRAARENPHDAGPPKP